MTRQIIATGNAPSSPLFSQGVRVGSAVHVSGMVGVDVTTAELAGPSVQQQTTQALRNCQYVLEAAGCSLHDVGMVTVLLADPADFAGMNEAYAAFFGDEPPARAVARLGPELPGILVSITMTAHVGEPAQNQRDRTLSAE
jgi:2-iminobutanoate/2-iminopropanoate deaminase